VKVLPFSYPGHRAWFAKIHEVRFPSERCLPPFGSALHLAGKQGLVELLRAKGYIVKPAPHGLEAKPKAR
jgi:hypothetical protein